MIKNIISAYFLVLFLPGFPQENSTVTEEKSLHFYQNAYPDAWKKYENKTEIFPFIYCAFLQTLHDNNADTLDWATQHLPMIWVLSQFNPWQVGKYDRRGIGMLAFPEARKYGLIISQYCDQRFDMVKSIKVASAYYQSLNQRFQDDAQLRFILGVVGYSKTSEKERRNIMAKLASIEQVMDSCDCAMLDFSTPIQWAQQSFSQNVYIPDVIEMAGIDSLTFRIKNPIFTSDVIPQGIPILLPNIINEDSLLAKKEVRERQLQEAYENQLKRIRDDIPSFETHKLIVYKIKSGDVLGRISRKFGVSIKRIKKWNKLYSDRIYIGQTLKIYVPKHNSSKRENSTKNDGFFTYKVQPGDTLWRISRMFESVTPADIMRWNGIDENLAVGQELKIKKQP